MAFTDDRWHRVVTIDGKKKRERTARYGHGKRWRVRYPDPDGRERSRSFITEPEAKAFRATVEADILRGTYVDPWAGKVTLRAYAQDWLKGCGGEATTREKTAERVRVHILPALGDYPLAHLGRRPSIIQAWVSNLPLSDNYKRAVFSCLSAILRAAVGDGLIARNPCKVESVSVPKEPKRKVVPWERSRAEAVRAALPERYRAMVDCGTGLGLRQGEVFGLAASDIDWLRGIVHVRRQVRIVGSRLCFAPPKGNRERDVPLPEAVKIRLSAHLAAHPVTVVALPWLEPGGKLESRSLIFTTSKRTALNRAYFGQYVWRGALREAGVIAATPAPSDREHGFHALRHHFASVLLAAGVDIRKLSAYLGHHDPGFTLRVYAHLIPDGGETMRQAIDALFAQSTGPEPGQSAQANQ